ncbi:EAL domain-containing protein [Alteromonas sp. BL110]|uniref:sensor domain-containing phosphodiesterase n=1 Tax=Alteromonas sp. BL110 TaxID=1714845 RepID=UPI000E4A27ED|nr:EAL domain-containing protein [Alteromonas sp. BL110]AXT40192.1 EAL domain-containing protein [Alteromonas sp. BL110]RKM79423.1 EAL domain-containing protein [Alteromonas sp. BL110]
MAISGALTSEVERISILKRLALLDTPNEERFDRITRLASSVLNCRFATITLIDTDRQWFKSSFNIDLKESARDIAFCSHTIYETGPFIVPDTQKDPRFKDNPFVLGEPHIRFYAGIRLIVDGCAVGTLCVLDTKPHDLSENQLFQLEKLAELANAEICREEHTELSKQITEYQDRLEQTQKLTRVRSTILEKVVNAESLHSVLFDIVDAIEGEYPNKRCSILLLQEGKLRKGAAPSLPEFYNDAIDGLQIGHGVGSCGNAAATNSPTVVEDISTHPYWDGFHKLAAKAGLASCWSQPIRGANGNVIGTFAVYHSYKAIPTPEEVILIEQFAHIASIAIERDIANDLIWNQANYDTLTGLPNRNLMLDHLDLAIKAAKRENDKVAVLFLDLDNFKDINDTLGHDVGDELLKDCAKRLKQNVRANDTVSRLGGDEFVLILSSINNLSSVDDIIQKLLEVIAEPFLIDVERVHTSGSLGVTLYPDDADNTKDLLKYADQAMYKAKASGKNSYKYYTLDMHEAAVKRLSLLNDLRYAVKNNELFVEYQPITTLSNGQILKAEALLRWQHPQKGRIPPDEFIPLAEESGLIIEISDWVFNEVCRNVKYWQSQYRRDLQISINTSPSHYFHQESNITDWLNRLLEMNISARSILLEVTENLLMKADAEVSRKLFQFRQAGVGIALDDFGTGYSSISYLKKFPTDFIKIDKSFVKTMTDVSNDKVLCEAIIIMAKKLGIKVVAEGIETREQFEILKGMECDYGQGYYIARPMSKLDFESLLKATSTVSSAS